MTNRFPEAPLRIGFDDPFRPLAWHGARGPEGPLLAIVARALAAAGFQWTFVPLPLPRSLAALGQGEVDGLAFKAVVPDRGSDLLFTRPLMTTGAALFTLAGRALDAGPDYRGTLATPAQGPLVGLLEKRFPGASRLLTEDYPSALQAVVDGRAHAAALNLHVGWHFAQALHPGRFALPEKPIATLPLAMVFPASGARDRDLLDESIQALQEAGAVRAALEEAGVPVLD